jgi:RNA polymerase sigma-70 factor (ECF subfamily)
MTNKHSGWPSTQVFLLDRVAASMDDPAWQAFVDLYLPIVFRFSRRRGLSVEDADEVTQNVFVNIVRTIPTFQYDVRRGRFRSWLCTIACHEIARHRDRNRRQVTSRGDDLDDALFDGRCNEVEAAWCEAFYAGIYEAACTQARTQFDAETWQAFNLAWEQQVPAADVGRMLGKNINWIYKAKFRVLKTLQALVAELAADEPALTM